MAWASSGGMESRASPTASSNSASDRWCMCRVCHEVLGAAARAPSCSVAVATAGRWRGLRDGVAPGGLGSAVADPNDLGRCAERRHEADDGGTQEEPAGNGGHPYGGLGDLGG